MPNSHSIFDSIVKVAHEKPLVIFDLDSTLYNVSHRTQKIIENFSKEPDIASRFPDEVARLTEIRISHRDWGMKEAFLRASFQAPEAFAKSIRDYWNQHFFSSSLLHEDKPYTGAVEYVNGLHRAGAEVWYLTGRDARNMREGTIRSLAQWNFPVANLDERLIMKPFKGSHEDEDFKDIQIRDLKAKAPKVWFFENEPVIIHKVRATSPDVQIVWVDTTHSRKASPPEGLPVVRDIWHIEKPRV
jgi:hypothetical protein